MSEIVLSQRLTLEETIGQMGKEYFPQVFKGVIVSAPNAYPEDVDIFLKQFGIQIKSKINVLLLMDEIPTEVDILSTNETTDGQQCAHHNIFRHFGFVDPYYFQLPGTQRTNYSDIWEEAANSYGVRCEKTFIAVDSDGVIHLFLPDNIFESLDFDLNGDLDKQIPQMFNKYGIGKINIVDVLTGEVIQDFDLLTN